MGECIKYGVKHLAQVNIRVYDVTGRCVRVLVNKTQKQGWYTVIWDGRDDHARRLPSGIYFVRMTADKFTGAQKLILLR